MRRRRRGRQLRYEPGTVPLTELKPGDIGVIMSILGSSKVAKRLADLGLTPETRIKIIKTAPLNGPIEVYVRGSRLAIGREVAENVIIRIIGN